MISMESGSTAQNTQSGVFDNLLQKQVLAVLKCLQFGHVRLLRNGSVQLLGDADKPAFATLYIGNDAFFGKVGFGGSVGAGESYMDGDWQCDDLVAARPASVPG